MTLGQADFLFQFVVIYGFVGIIFGLFTMTVAQKKGYGELSWLAAGFFFSIVALIAAAGLPLKRDADDIARQARKNSPAVKDYIAEVESITKRPQ